MAEKNEKTLDKGQERAPSRLPEPDRGLLHTVVVAGGELTARATEAAFGALRDLQSETFTRTSSALDFVDETQQGMLNVVRRVVARVDHLTLACIGAGEAITASVVRTGRGTSEGAIDLVGRTADAVAGKRAA
ncbi:MAG: hypothetical protein IT383_20450 [Deltaproteobacteria bacterium]|nr:hypothetical protein [Deltaproteobacteria bacterium]